jgi:hypothetical protein
LCVGVGGDRIHASRPRGAGYARLSPTRLGGIVSANGPGPEWDAESDVVYGWVISGLTAVCGYVPEAPDTKREGK